MRHYPPSPRIARGRFLILGKYDAGSSPETPPREASARVLIQRAGEAPQVLALDTFLAQWSGELIFFTSKATYAGDIAKFDFSWFIPAVIKYRRLLGEVVLISLVLQIIGLVTPMFFQVVMDKVLVNHAMKTLNVIAIGLLCAILFEALLTGIRTYVFAHTSSKIDVELGACLFRHLLSLPIGYFQARRVGDSVARIRELENIRSFLTGNAITLVMDLLFSFVFLAVMLWYSVWLAGVPSPVRHPLCRLHAHPAGAPQREVQPQRREPVLPCRNHQRHRHRQGHGRRATLDPEVGQAGVRPSRGHRCSRDTSAQLG